MIVVAMLSQVPVKRFLCSYYLACGSDNSQVSQSHPQNVYVASDDQAKFLISMI